MTPSFRSQPSRISSPWTFRYRCYLLLWGFVWTLFCSWSPKPFNPFRIFILRVFGARVSYNAFVHQRALIAHPCNLELLPGSCIGDRTHLYNISLISIHAGAVVAQEAYLCTATHDFNVPELPLKALPITVLENAFVGARAFLLPGVTIGQGSIVGACSVVTRSVPDFTTVAGNPARSLY